MDGDKAARVLELAQKARHARRMAAEYIRRWAVEQTVDNVGLVALSTGLIDVPLQRNVDAEVGSGAANDA